MNFRDVRWYWIAIGAAIVGWLGFAFVVAPIVVTGAYHGRSLSVLNRLIEGQETHSLEYYLDVWSVVRFQATIVIVAGAIVLSILVSNRRVLGGFAQRVTARSVTIGTGTIVGLSVLIGGVAGFSELLIVVFRRGLSDYPGHWYPSNTAWMTPVATTLAFLLVGLALALCAKVLPKVFGIQTVFVMLICLAAYSVVSDDCGSISLASYPGDQPLVVKRPTLTVILATIEPWPDLERCLSVLEPQVEALGAEIIVGDGHGGALEARYAESPSLQWIRAPGASVFDLRAQALEMARGEIVAVTEDHCVVASDWCQQILKSLEDAPDKMAMTGPVMNGSPDRLSDWANYLHTFGCFHPPVDAGQRDRCPPAANVAYRRKVIPAGSILAGWMELELTPRLFAEGLFGVCDGMTVTHVQSHGFWKTLLAHFDNGRTTTGLHHISLSQRQLPWFLFRETVRGLDRSQSPRPIIRKSLPLLFLLSTCHALGEVLGILAGPGESPRRLR